MKDYFVKVYEAEDANINLFLFPFAGGTAQSYRFLYQSGDFKRCNIFALEIPGRGVRMFEPFTKSVDEIREACLSAITPYLCDRMIFLGHSMGAILAYELMREVESLYPDYRLSLLISAANSPGSLKLKHDIFKMTKDEFKAYVINMGGLPEQILVNDRLIEFFLPRIYSDFGLLQQYKPKNDTPLRSPIHVIAPSDDLNIEKDFVLDWKRYTTSIFSIEWCTGGHFYLYQRDSLLKKELHRMIGEISQNKKQNLSLEEKRKLLRELLEKKVNAHKKYQASPGQKALWIFTRANTQSPAYHLKFTAKITPRIPIERLESCLALLISRHSVLRAHFVLEDNVLYQVFEQRIDFKIINKESNQQDIQAHIIEDYSKPFDLGVGPLIRCFVYNFNHNEQVLLLVIHHILIDGVSLLHFVSELGQVLNGSVISEPNKTPYDYPQYLQYVHQLKSTEGYAASKRYWLNKLADTQGQLNLPYDRERKTLPSFAGGAVIRTLSCANTLSLKNWASEEKITLHALLLGVYQLLLHKICRQNRVLSVTPCLGRDKKEFFSIIGYFANMVVIDTDIGAAQDLKAFISSCRRALVAALEHQQIPFTELVQDLRHLKRSPTSLSLAQAAFAFHQPLTSSQSLNVDLFAPQANTLSWDDSQIVPFRVTPAACQFELYLVALEESDGSISLHFEFMRDVFDEETIAAIANYYMELLHTVLKQPASALSELPDFVKFTAMEQVVSQFNDTAKPTPDITLTRFLYENMPRNRSLIAVVDSQGEYRYEDILKLSFGLATKLPRSLDGPLGIGILLEKGVEQIIAILATIWTGNYFIPINIENPPSRIADIITQANMQYFITSQPLLLSKQLDAMHIIDIAAIEPTEDYPIVDVRPNNVLYVIFTSGTTGTPKGVAISHQSLLNTVLGINEGFKLNSGDSVFALSDLSFDLAMYDVFGMLLLGGKIVFCPQAFVKEPKEWLRWIHQYQITFWNSVPMLLAMLLEQTKDPLPFKYVFLSGDWISVDLVARAHALCPSAQVVSVGGPTETTIWSIHYPLSRQVQYEYIPYGYPLPNHRYYVLDENLALCGYGQLGELYTGGLGLALSYLNDEERTQQAFFEHPRFGRLYRSGDMGYLTPEFGICIKGRCDRQVKIGGYRIELDDVRTSLEKCFKNYTITCSTTGPAHNKRLVGFIQAIEAMHEEYQLIEHIAEDPRFSEAYEAFCDTLPVYMIPDLFVLVKAFPLSRNNKIDYSRLPDLSQVMQQNKLVQTLTPAMQKMAIIWAKVLELSVDHICAESHFFQLGGDSLRAVSLINEVDKEFSLSCHLKSLFDMPTLAAFTETVLNSSLIDNEFIVQLQSDQAKRYESFPLTPVQQAYWIGSQNQLELGNVSSHSYYEFDMKQLDVARFQQALDKTIARHDMLRMVINSDGKQRVLKETAAYPLEFVNLEHETPKNRDKRLEAIRKQLSHEVVSMQSFPAFRLKVVQLQQKYRIIISYDALQFDAWSFLIFIQDLSKYYANPELKQKNMAICFRDYVQYLEELVNTFVYQKAKEYWTERLPTMPYGPELPLQAMPKQQEFNRLQGFLAKDKWTALVNKAKGLSCTPTGLMLAVFSLVIRGYSRKPDFCLNLTLFNRLAVHPDIEDVIGDFTSLILFEVKETGSNHHFAHFLSQIQAQLFSDLDHRIYDGISVQRDLRRLNTKCPKVIAPIVFTSTLGFAKPRLLSEQDELEVDLHYSITQTPQVWLDKQIREDEEGVHWVWDYLNGLFNLQTIKAMHKSCEKILHELVDHNWNQYAPQVILPEASERLIAYNETIATPPEINLTRAVVDAMQRHEKDSIAVIDSQGLMSYQELEEATRRLAFVIQLQNYPSGSAIGVFLEKGREQAIACLAILFAGHYFVPFNLANPSHRLSFLIKESEICAIVSTMRTASLYQIPEALLIDVHSPSEKQIQKIANPALDDIAYVIYTSGSTGTPKGVVITHCGVMNTLIDINTRFSVGSDDKVLALSDLSFDLAIYDLFGMLLAGGAVVYPQVEQLKEPSHWLHLIRTYHITIWNSVPMLYAMLLHPQELISSLKTVLLSGDWIMPEVVYKGYALCPNAILNALGGATECSIWSNHYLIEKHVEYEYIPYGFPLANQQLYILHQDLTQCPEGVEGELYIGGLGLAREYFRDKEKTRSSFIEHQELGRLYRTGDWGMMSLEHGIKFLGRQDSQVKVGGYRIELNEIEYALRKCLGIEELLIDVEESNNSKRLIAYCVVNEKTEEKKIQQLSHANIRHFERKSTKIGLKETPDLSDESLWFHRKSYRQWIKAEAEITAIKLLLTQAGSATKNLEDDKRLVKALLALSAIQDSSTPIAKYRYPSAGGLYPVQCYLSLSSESLGIAKGRYYWSPIQAGLIKIGDEPVLEYDALFLIADSALIKPYYPSAWREFCDIEAGHMTSLIQRWVGVKETTLEEFQPSLFCLSEQHVLLKTFQFCLGEQAVNPSIDLSIYLNKSDQVFHLNSKENRWSEEKISFELSSLGRNAKIVNEAMCYIVFASYASAFDIGVCTQRWMERLAENYIGSVYIGNLSLTRESNTQTYCGLALGIINHSMLISKAISKNELNKQDLISQAYTRLKHELPDYMIPSDFILLDKLPMNANGKIDKNALPRKILLEQNEKGKPISDKFEKKIETLWRQSLNLSSQELYQDSDFFSLGGDSLKALEMLSLVKEQLALQLDLKTIFDAPTFRAFCRKLHLLQMSELIDSSEFVALNTPNNQLPLMVLVHPGTGTIDCFLGFSQEFQGDYELLAIQYKDHKAKNLYELGAHYAHQLMAKYKNRPVHILGYSLGAYIAFEMAKTFEKHDVRYATLSLVDALPINNSEDIFYESEDEINLFEKVLIEDYGITEEKIHTLLSYINEKQNSLLKLCENYLTTGSVRGRVAYFKAREVTPYLKNKLQSVEVDFWDVFSSSQVQEFDVEGNHMNIFSSQHIESFINAYNEFLG